MNTNSNVLAKKISDLTPDDLPSLTPFESGASASAASASSKTSFFSNVTWQTWIIIILILAFLGINVFVYLGKGVQEITDFLSPILKWIGYGTAVTAKQTIDVSADGAKTGINITAEGTKTGVDIISDTATGAVDLIQETTDMAATASGYNAGSNNARNSTVVPGKQANSSLPTQSTVNRNIITSNNATDSSNLQNALADASRNSSEVMPDDSKSSVQWGAGKSGWCYIGEDHGTRTCGQVGVNDVCMSGDIFPSQEICINPNLRP